MEIVKTHVEVINNCNELFNICNKTNQPVFITKDGKRDLVALSLKAYEHILKEKEK